MSDLPGPPSRPEEPPGDPVPPQVEGRAGSGVDTAVARTNAITRRTLVAILASLFLFGSCGIAYGVYRVAGAGGGGGTPTLSPVATTGPSGSTGSVSPTPSPTGPGPDLVVESIWGTQVVVRNIGADPAGRFVVSVGERALFVEAGLDPGEAATFDFPCRPGPLTAVADSTERVEEADEANNTLTAGPFDCASPSATPTTTTATTTTQPPKLPDLVIRSVTEDSVTVVNVGRGHAGAFTVSVGKAGSFKVGGLDPGRGATFGFSCTGGNLTATADPSNQVAESNESNNTRTGGPFSCLADLIVSAIDRDSVTIANVGDGAGASHVSIAGQVLDVPPIPDGQKVTVQYQCVGGLVDVVADVQDEVQESNESNNTDSADLGPC